MNISNVQFIPDMPSEEYHALDRLSASGIKHLLSGPLDYWYYTYGLGAAEESTAAQKEGTAKHVAGLEGLEVFRAHYEPVVCKEDYPGALDKQDELKDWCKSRGLAVGGSKQVLCDRIRDACRASGDVLPPLWMLITRQQELAAEDDGREILSQDAYSASLSKATQIAPLIEDLRAEGGIPESTILWEQGGIPCKARPDFLSPRKILDMKNVANKYGAPFAEVCHSEIARRNMPIQAEWYLRAVLAANKAKNLPFDLAGNVSFCWMFLQSAGPANIVIRNYIQHRISFDDGKRARTVASTDARSAISGAMDLYAQYQKSHGKDRPWDPPLDDRDLDDTDLPPWFVL